ncbi:MAG: hypothetical protein PHH88_02005 [Candidatus Pacebacteria bacterium]|nr:hypothetical protein [Candidatus Paceibacterota bacterium]
MNKKIIAILLSIALIALIVFAIINYKQENSAPTKEEVVNKALTYINENLMTSGYSASLKEIQEIENKNPSYYIFTVNIAEQPYELFVTADGSKLVTDMRALTDLNEKVDAQVDGSFLVRENAEIITEDGKPVIYLFTSSTCPHCEWEKPVIQAVVDTFGDNVVYKLREDTAEDQNVYTQYGNGGVPLVLIGGKYYREGAGENFGEEAEKGYLTKYICELTNNIPETVCNK